MIELDRQATLTPLFSGMCQRFCKSTFPLAKYINDWHFETPKCTSTDRQAHKGICLSDG